MNVYIVMRWVDFARGVDEVDSVWMLESNAKARSETIAPSFNEIVIKIIEDAM